MIDETVQFIDTGVVFGQGKSEEKAPAVAVGARHTVTPQELDEMNIAFFGALAQQESMDLKDDPNNASS